MSVKRRPGGGDVRELRPLILTRRVRDSLARGDMELLERLDQARRLDVAELSPPLDPERVLWLAYFGLVLLEVNPADRVYLVRNREALSELRGAASAEAAP